ncbi:unnamed protein product [Prunus armeniaca]
MYFSRSSTGNGDIRNGNQDQQLPESFGSTDNWVGNQDENQLGCNQEVLSSVGYKHHLSRLISIVVPLKTFILIILVIQYQVVLLEVRNLPTLRQISVGIMIVTYIV